MIKSADFESGIRNRSRPFILAAATGLAVFATGLEGGLSDLVNRQGVSIFIWWWLALACFSGLAFRLRPHRGTWVAALALAGLASWMSIGLAWSSNDETTTTEIARAVTYLGVVAAVIAIVPAERWRAVVAGAAGGAVAVCAWALIQRFWPGSFDATVSIFPGDSRRLSAPFGYWNAVGAWAGMTTALCLGWAVHARTMMWRALAAAAVPVAVLAAYLTYSRAAVGGTAFGLLILLALSRNRFTLVCTGAAAALSSGAAILVVRGQPQIADATGGEGAGVVLLVLGTAALTTAAAAIAAHAAGADRVRLPRRAARVVIPVGAVAGVVAVAVLATTVGPTLWDQFTTTSKQEGTADPAARLTDLNGARYDHWKVAYHSFEDAPWKGSGAGTFEYAWNQEGYGFVRDAHSLYFEALAETGIPGLALILLFIGGFVWALIAAIVRLENPEERGVLAAAAAAVGAYLLGAGVDWLWESPAVTVLAMVLVGAVCLAASRPAAAPRWPWRMVLALGAILLCAVQLPGLVSTSEVRKSQTALRDGNVSEARRHADNAIDAQPWAASPFVQRALVDERADALNASAQELRAAAARAPKDWRTYVLLARVEAQRGDAPAALRALRRARALRPGSAFFQPSPAG